MNETKSYIDKLKRFLEIESEEGRKLIKIKQQRRADKTYFNIHPVYKKKHISSINVEKSTLPGDTILPISVFEIVIKSLLDQEGKVLPKGKAQKAGVKIGDNELDNTTLESIVAINIYEKEEKDSVYRRLPVVSNILVQAGICENIRKDSRLRLIEL